MAKMNWNRVQKVTPAFYPDATKRRGCAHVWLKKSEKWDTCTKCHKFKPRANYLAAHPEEYKSRTASGPTSATE